jgi:hypothetical protein
MVYAHQIRSVVAKYLAKSFDANGFLREFSPLSRNIQRDGDAEAVRLADRIESYIADLRAGCIKELQFRSALRELTYTAAVNTFFSGPVCFPAGINHYSVPENAFPEYQAPSGTSPAVELGSTVFLQG